MNISRISLSLIIISCVFFSCGVFAEVQAECTVSDTAASPLQQWRENIDMLNSAFRREAAKTQCDTSTTGTVKPAFVNYIGQIVPLDSSVSLMREIYSLSSTGADFFAEVDSFLNPAGPVMELKPHADSIEEIERSILETAEYVGSRCAQSVKINTNILEGKAGYDTRGRTISEVLVAMAQQTKEVKRFFQILSQGIQTEEYIDEVPFLIASPGFSKGMYVYFSPKNIQACRDNDSRKGAFMDVLKGAFTSGWKYPQAIQVWKDAMALLIYRGSQLVGAGSTDTNKDARINSIVQARKGGVGNSDIMINSQTFKELGYRPNSQSTDEKIDTSEKKAFYESMGYEFVRKVIPNLIAQAGANNTGFVKNIQTKEELEKVQRLQDLEESLYSQYRGVLIDENKANDPQLASDLAQIIHNSKKQRKTLEETYKDLCATLNKQAVNISGAWRCQ